MGYYGWAPYVSVAERREKAEKAAAKAKKAGADFSPIAAYRGSIAKTFWGKAWCDNLESYSDYANRLPRGRTYVRNGSVIDLKITEGQIHAQVMGSSLYKVAIKVTAVPAEQWKAIGADCSGSIDSLVELLQGKLSTAVMQRICTPRTGLFPAPKEISFSCSCPDSASMCKHIAAVLYGVGARLDQNPELLFSLRRVDAKDLVSQAGAGIPQKTLAQGKVLDNAMLADVFGIEMDESPPCLQPAAAKTSKKKASQPTSATAAETNKKPRAPRKTATAATEEADSVGPRPPSAPTSKRKLTPGKAATAKTKTGKTKNTADGG